MSSSCDPTTNAEFTQFTNSKMIENIAPLLIYMNQEKNPFNYSKNNKICNSGTREFVNTAFVVGSRELLTKIPN